MAHEAVQDLLDRVWFGGIEPCRSSLSVTLGCLFPFLVPFLFTPSKDKLIDRVDLTKSGYCFGFFWKDFGVSGYFHFRFDMKTPK